MNKIIFDDEKFVEENDLSVKTIQHGIEKINIEYVQKREAVIHILSTLGREISNMYISIDDLINYMVNSQSEDELKQELLEAGIYEETFTDYPERSLSELLRFEYGFTYDLFCQNHLDKQLDIIVNGDYDHIVIFPKAMSNIVDRILVLPSNHGNLSSMYEELQGPANLTGDVNMLYAETFAEYITKDGIDDIFRVSNYLDEKEWDRVLTDELDRRWYGVADRMEKDKNAVHNFMQENVMSILNARSIYLRG